MSEAAETSRRVELLDHLPAEYEKALGPELAEAGQPGYRARQI